MQLYVRSFMTSVSIVPLSILVCHLQLMMEQASWGGRAVTAEVGVPKVDEAAVALARVVRGGALIVGMLVTKAPLTSLP